MANARASSKKNAKKKAAKKKSAPARKKKGRPVRKVLTPDERSALLAGREGWEDVADDVTRAMKARGLRVDGVSAAKITSLAARALKARQREEELLEKQARALAPVADARRLADDAAWRALLEVLATVRFKARNDPTLLDDFASLLDLMKNEPAPKPPVA